VCSTVTTLSNSSYQEAWENITSLIIGSKSMHPVVFRTHCLTRLHNLERLSINVKNQVLKQRVFYGLRSLEHLTLVSLDILYMNVASFNLTYFNANCQRLNILKNDGTSFRSVHIPVKENHAQSYRKIRVCLSSATLVKKIKMWYSEYKTYFTYSAWPRLTSSFLFSRVNVETIDNMWSQY